jgi:L-alanine-DL-glutamate epimerase-like enolase superfamily enzyme
LCSKQPLYRWTVDANSAWTPQLTLQALDVITAAGKHVSVIEQPFPVTFKSELKADGAQAADAQAWQAVKEACTSVGVDIYADESVCTVDDVELLAPYVHGVNVKMDKAGGFRGAVRALHAAKEKGLKTWIGMMVGSKLASTAASHLLPLAVAADLDGAPLVTEASQAMFQVFSLSFSNMLTLDDCVHRESSSGCRLGEPSSP